MLTFVHNRAGFRRTALDNELEMDGAVMTFVFGTKTILKATGRSFHSVMGLQDGDKIKCFIPENETIVSVIAVKLMRSPAVRTESWRMF
ncbi:MAG: hypothetical protein ACLRMZ_25350 [Blautia marasmi]